jgi:hypothetical protein
VNVGSKDQAEQVEVLRRWKGWIRPSQVNASIGAVSGTSTGDRCLFQILTPQRRDSEPLPLCDPLEPRQANEALV